MRQYVIATHGFMAGGMKSTLEIIIGPQKNLTCINAYTNECPDPMPEFNKIIDENPDDEIIIMTDLMGGSVNNNAMVLTENKRVHVVTGTNLAVAIAILMSNENDSVESVIEKAVNSGKEMIIHCEIEDTNEEDDDDF